MNKKDILAARNKVEALRDFIGEHSGELTEKKAKELFALPFEKIVAELPESATDELFKISLQESESSSGGVIWGSAFNSYAALLELMKVVRTPGEFKESSPPEFAEEIMGAANRVAAIFHVFRKHKNIPAPHARLLLELAYGVTLTGLSNVARQAVFTHAHDRASNLLETANQYGILMDIVPSVKLSLYPELTAE